MSQAVDERLERNGGENALMLFHFGPLAKGKAVWPLMEHLADERSGHKTEAKRVYDFLYGPRNKPGCPRKKTRLADEGFWALKGSGRRMDRASLQSLMPFAR